MNRISFNDNRKNRIVDLFIGPDNVLRKDYFHGVFPEATGIIFYDNEVNLYVGIPRDENGSFKFEWSPNVMYELVYRDEPQNRSISFSSNSSKIWNWLTIAGSTLEFVDLNKPIIKKEYSDTFSWLSVHMAWFNDFLVMVAFI
ncbi:unnamed protein product [Rotaria socialis]